MLATPAVSPSLATPPDCPARLAGVLEPLVGPCPQQCRLRCVRLEPREPFPESWSHSYAFGLVRRGVLLRGRPNACGAMTLVDAVGAGSLLPLGGCASSGIAAGRALVCLATHATVEHARERGVGVDRDLVRLQSLALTRLERILDARARPSAEASVAALLATLADTLQPQRRRQVLPSSLQQRDMAALLGLRHETVCRALGSLEARGLLQRTSDGIALRDVEGLAHLAH
ncbi:MAG: helix-turn-helix domain-containing protein [Myxococcota bacterium]|nr:helix-turn-helix domain-containing protein [Myxococcota bacterium]